MHGDLEAVDHRLLNEIFAPARARHGHAAWDRACHEGARMPLEAAATYALVDYRHTSGSRPTAAPH